MLPFWIPANAGMTGFFLDSRSPIGVGDKLRGNDGLLSRIQYRVRRLIIVTRRLVSAQNRQGRLLRRAHFTTFYWAPEL